jgi:hypothetical protein
VQLPDRLHDRPFPEWNQLVRDFMLLWQLAAVFGCQQAFEEFVNSDEHCRAAEFAVFVANAYHPDGRAQEGALLGSTSSVRALTAAVGVQHG